MAVLHVSPEIRYRDESGRFLADCDAAGTAAVQAVVDEGVSIARRLAPDSPFPDPRGPDITSGLEGVMTGPMTGHVVSRARHTLAQERGASAHSIGAPGQLLGNRAKGWGPVRGPVRHPGNAPQPFMGPMYAILRKKMIDVMRQFYPG